MKLSDFEFRACQILLAAARAGADYDEMMKEMRQECIPERIWVSLYSSSRTDSPRQRMTMDEARRIATNIAKLPTLLRIEKP